MGCECPPAAAAVTTVHVTGFKKFHGVSENPTETIVNNLKVHMNKKGLPKGLVIGSCNILETSGQGALIPLHQTLQSSISAKESEFSSSNKIIWASSNAIMFTIIHFDFPSRIGPNPFLCMSHSSSQLMKKLKCNLLLLC